MNNSRGQQRYCAYIPARILTSTCSIGNTYSSHANCHLKQLTFSCKGMHVLGGRGDRSCSDYTCAHFAVNLCGRFASRLENQDKEEAYEMMITN